MTNANAMALLPARPPVMGISRNPLLALSQDDMQVVEPGSSVYALRPLGVKGSLRCYLNGESLFPVTPRQIAHHARLVRAGRDEDARVYLRRAVVRALNWKRTIVQPGDTLAWHEVTHDKDTLRTVLLVGIAVFMWWNPYGWTAGYMAFAGLAASLAVNILLPPSVPTGPQMRQGDNVFNTALNGNQARLDQPIWKNCGLTKVTPPFAATPYYEYVDTDHDNLDNDQYLHIVYAVGIGKQDVLRVFIGKTPIEHYQDVTLHQYLPPGTQPTRVLCNVVTSLEVSGIELESGKYAGGYVVCRPDQRCANFGIDVSAPQGLGTATGDSVTIAWRIEVREVDRFGRPTSVWRIIHNESRTASTNTPQRWSVMYGVATAARFEVRIVRTDVKDTSPGTRSAVQWIGLRGYLNTVAPLNADTGHYELIIRASEQLSSQSQSDISMIVQGYTRTWSPDGGWSATLGDYDNYTATRNPAWWLAELWTSPVWGEGLPDDRIHLQGLYDFAQICDARQDRFDFTFLTSMNAWDAAQLIARAGRARCFRRFGVNTLARDQLATLPVTAFTHRNTAPGSMMLTEKLPIREAADGYRIEYTSNITWDIETIDCPCPGYSVSDPEDPRYNPALPAMVAPVYMRLEGIKGATHAQREGLYEAAVMLLRNRVVKCTTEMQGVIPCYGDPVRWMPEIAGYGQSGDVTYWDAVSLVMGLSEPADFSAGPTYLALIRDDGSLTDPVLVTAGPSEHEVRLPAAPDFTLVIDDGRREQPKFLLGTLADADELVKVTGITDGGKSSSESDQAGVQLFDITAVVDDARVHSADVHLLPGPGDEQDVIETDQLVEGGQLLLHLEDHRSEFLTLYMSGGALLVFANALDGRAEYTLTNDGHGYARLLYAPFGDGGPLSFASEWVYGSTIETSEAELYEVRATYIASLPSYYASLTGYIMPPNFGDAIDTWLNLGTTRTWGFHNTTWGGLVDYGACTLFMEIREISNPAVIQASSTILIGVLPPGEIDHGGPSPGE